MPRTWTSGPPITSPQECFTGVFVRRDRLPAEGLVFATDASGGPSLRLVAWSIVACRIQEGQVQVVGTVTGLLPEHQSVFRGEALAASRLCELTCGHVDLTVDCLAVKKRFLKNDEGRANNDVLTSLRENRCRTSLFWVRSHLTFEQFCGEFGTEHSWRWQANNFADVACKCRAEQHFQPSWEARNSRVDELAKTVHEFLVNGVKSLCCLAIKMPVLWFSSRMKLLGLPRAARDGGEYNKGIQCRLGPVTGQ